MWRMVAFAALLPAVAAADGFKHREKSPNAPPLPKIEFFCTDASGGRREIGEVMCIATGCQTYLAKCGMSLNNPAWRKIQDGCPGASLMFSPAKRLDPAFDTHPVHPQIATPETQPS